MSVISSPKFQHTDGPPHLERDFIAPGPVAGLRLDVVIKLGWAAKEYHKRLPLAPKILDASLPVVAPKTGRDALRAPIVAGIRELSLAARTRQ